MFAPLGGYDQVTLISLIPHIVVASFAYIFFDKNLA